MNVGDLVKFRYMQPGEIVERYSSIFLVVSAYEPEPEHAPIDDWDWELLDMNDGSTFFAYTSELVPITETL